jgi:hypothetical protein
MDGATVVADALFRVSEVLHRVVDGMGPKELFGSPKPPIGWLVWHLTRVQDREVALLAGRDQLWVADGWHARFGMPADVRDYAPGHIHIPEQVEAFPVIAATLLLDYFDAVFADTKEYLSGLSGKDLDTVLEEPQYQPLPTVGVRLVSVVADNLRHAGQVEYLSGLLQHQGWFPAKSPP